MPHVLPSFDGQVLPYQPEGFIGPPHVNAIPRIYFVNGIRVMPDEHAASATELAGIAERVVLGVYNKTAGQKLGSVVDLLQCADDWLDSATAQLGEWTGDTVNKAATFARDLWRRVSRGDTRRRQEARPVNVANAIRRQIPERARLAMIDTYLSTSNRATTSLFRQLRAHQGHEQWIVAHSQGNLITSNAVWAMVLAYGDESLKRVRVYSLASPAPSWPEGLNYQRKVYGFRDDPVTKARPQNWKPSSDRFGRSEGHWQDYSGKKIDLSLGSHDAKRLMFDTTFANRLRHELGLPLWEERPIPPSISR